MLRSPSLLLLGAWGLGLGSCATAPSDSAARVADAAACPEQGPGAEVCVLEAVAAGRAGAEACGGLQEPAVRDACWLAVAEGERRLESCAAIGHAAYREHCGLVLLERQVGRLDPAAWASACGQWTGAMAGHCLQHGVEMWARGLTGAEGRPRFRADALVPAFAAIYAAAAEAGIERGLEGPDPYEALDRSFLLLVSAAEPGRELARCHELGLPRSRCAEARTVAAEPRYGLGRGGLRWADAEDAAWY
jgi:hypothetical protein